MKTLVMAAFLASSALLLASCIGAGQLSDIQMKNDDTMPSMIGIDLHGNDRPVPESFEGDLNIVTFAFEREQQDNVNTWIPVADAIGDDDPSIRFYEIPLIYEINAMYRTWVNNGMRSGIPGDEARDRTITVYTDRDKFFDLMEMNNSTIYTLLIDPQGKILWRSEGDATDEKIASLKQAIKDAKGK